MRFFIDGFRHFVQNLILTLRAMLPVRFDLGATHTGAGQVFLALATANTAAVVYMAVEMWPVGGIDPWGVTSLLASSFISLAALTLAALIVRREDRAVALVIAGSLASILSFPLWWLLDSQTDWTKGFYGMWLIWGVWFLPQTLVLLRGLAGSASLGRLRGVPAAVVYLGIFVPAGLMLPSTEFFYPGQSASEDDAEIAYRPVDVEGLYYAQPERMHAAIAAIKPGQSGEREVFALLGAGTAAQGVFVREISQVAGIARDKLNADGRILSLANSRVEPDRFPLLGKRNLGDGLSPIGRRMQPDEDLAFLFLTSHGSPDSFSLGFYEAGLDDLSPKDLSAMLDASGIRYAVIVISACYSGSFIDDLAAPGRIIITAAAADRTSFGCASENDWTDFGRAYFDQALRQTGDFRAAFDQARTTLAEREAKRGLTPSDPQISVGDEIAAYLDSGAWQHEGPRPIGPRPPSRYRPA